MWGWGMRSPPPAPSTIAALHGSGLILPLHHPCEQPWHGAGFFLVRIHRLPCRGLLFAPPAAAAAEKGGVEGV